MIFQDPFESLNSRHMIGDIIEEPFAIHNIGSAQERKAEVDRLLGRVGLSRNVAERFPHEFSGGQRQRIGIARVLTLNPALIIADEPVSALDVSIQAQIINLMVRLQDELELSYLFISHDLAVVEHISTRVAIMYLGKIVEIAPADNIYHHPQHPYTRSLLSAIPIPDPRKKITRTLLQGDLPSAVDPPSGCAFRTRCPRAQKICAEQTPEMKEMEPGHFAACHLL